MVEVNLKEYAKLLINNTKADQYEWEQMGDSKYRLLLKKGTVVLEKYKSASSSFFELSFYDTTTLIYKSNIYSSNSVYQDYLELYNTIISKNNEKINSAISDLFS